MNVAHCCHLLPSVLSLMSHFPLASLKVALFALPYFEDLLLECLGHANHDLAGVNSCLVRVYCSFKIIPTGLCVLLEVSATRRQVSFDIGVRSCCEAPIFKRVPSRFICAPGCMCPASLKMFSYISHTNLTHLS